MREEKIDGFKTGIDTFDQILGGHIKSIKEKGVLGVIFGSAGTGKSTLALQFCSRFLIEKEWKTRVQNKKNTYTAIYLTHENPYLIKQKIEDFSYFRMESDKIRHIQANKIFETKIDSLTNLLGDNNGNYQLHIIQIPFEENQQAPILQNVFDTLVQRSKLIKKDPYGNALVCIDNFRTVYNQAILSAMSGRKVETNSTTISDKYHQNKVHRNFYKELHYHCQQQGLHTFLVTEEDVPEGADSEKSDISSRPEVYAADIVIRLGIHSYDTGHRERFIQVLKAKNQFYYRGKHHCSIVSKYGGGRDDKKGDYGVVVYPSIPMQLSLLQKEVKNQDTVSLSDKFLNLGILSLDDKVEKAISKKGYILPGTNCVLVSDLDIKATEIALHFAMNPVGHGLYISFLHKEETLRNIAHRFWNKGIKKSKITIKDFSPEYISEHKLLRDIDRLICDTREHKAQGKPLLVVLDNVFELRCKYPLIKDARSFLAALMELFSKRKVTSLIVDTVEVGEGRNPIESSLAAGLADSVFLLRHVEFQSKLHRVFSILKLVGIRTPDHLWDLVEIQEQDTKLALEANDTFAGYKNVLSGRPDPVTITFSLYIDEEGSPFHEYLKGQIVSLKQLFGDSLNINLYGSEEYSRVHGFLPTVKRLPRGDCHIVALDEFWLKELIEKDLLEDISPYIPDKGRRSNYVCTAHDIALYKNIENDKRNFSSNDKLKAYYKQWYAVPARNNCGVLCFDKALAKRILNGVRKPNVKKWLNDPLGNKISWNELCELRSIFEKWLKKNKGTDRYPETFFTFCMDQIESYVCFILELALSYDKDGLFITRDRKSLSLNINLDKFPIEALQVFISLLGEETLKQLASGRFRSYKNEPAALFSRQWMSTLGCLHLRKMKIKKKIGLGIDIVPDCNRYFENLEPYPLPSGLNGRPTPVSGTWYLGILKGSTAVETGVGLIEQFTSVRNELYKLNHYIGFPVTKEFYESESYNLPYAQRFSHLSKVQSKFLENPEDDKMKKEYRTEMQKDYLLYRVLIENYSDLALILWRLMIKVAKEALTIKNASRLTVKQLKILIKDASQEYLAVDTKSK